MSSRPRRRLRSRWVSLIAGAAALAGAFVPVHPSGVAVADHLLAGAAVGLVSLAASRARRWTWLVLAGIAATFAAVPWASVAALFALAVGTVSVWRRRGLPEAGAVVGALGALASLRLVDGGLTGLSAVLALSAAAPVLASGYQHAGRAARRRARRSLWVAAAALTAVLLAYGTALTAARRSSAAGAWSRTSR